MPSTDQFTATRPPLPFNAANCRLAPAARRTEVGETKRLALLAAVTVTFAVALWLESAALVAVTLWLPTAAGAVYRPPLTPSTDQLTFWFEALCTVAENCCVPPAEMLAAAGEIVTVTPEEPGLFVPLEGLAWVPAHPTHVRPIARIKTHKYRYRCQFIQLSPPTALPMDK